jgi:retron-type reverse transcriptase
MKVISSERHIQHLLEKAKIAYQRHFSNDFKTEDFRIYCYGFMMSHGYEPSRSLHNAIDEIQGFKKKTI